MMCLWSRMLRNAGSLARTLAPAPLVSQLETSVASGHLAPVLLETGELTWSGAVLLT